MSAIKRLLLIAIVLLFSACNVGVDVKPDTRQLIQNAIDEIARQPDRWNASLSDLIPKLSGETQKTIEVLMKEMTDFTREITEDAGIEFRCTADFTGQKVVDALKQLLN